jgi:hypothetical protein
MANESPTYQVEAQIGDIELRRYEPYVVAETLVNGSLERAGIGGFRLLAGYIFGKNETAGAGAGGDGGAGDGGGGSTKIAMTSPVFQERVGDDYRVRFMMPSSFTADSLPTPTDARVTINEVGAELVAAIRYGGRWTSAGYERHLAKLSAALDGAGYTTVGEPMWARYDPPWTPWFQRRNEVLIAVRDHPAPRTD